MVPMIIWYLGRRSGMPLRMGRHCDKMMLYGKKDLQCVAASANRNSIETINGFNFFSFPTPPKITNCQTDRTGFLFAALHGQLADLPNGRGNFFLSPMHGIIPTIFENAKNGRKKTGNLFLISCLSVSSYPTAIFSFWLMDMFIVKI